MKLAITLALIGLIIGAAVRICAAVESTEDTDGKEEKS